MAVDTRLKRQSATCIAMPCMFSGMYPDTSGIVQAERQAITWSYSGILTTSGATVIIDIGSINLLGKDISINRSVNISVGSIALTGKDLFTSIDSTISIVKGAIAYTGLDFQINRVIHILKGLITFTGKSFITTVGGVIIGVFRRSKSWLINSRRR